MALPLAGLARAQYLETLTCEIAETGLVELRKGFMEAGLRDGERKVNYALQRTRTDRLWNKGWDGSGATLWDQIDVSFRKVCFDCTCSYGMYPGRPLQLLAVLWLRCAIPYAAVMFQRPRFVEKPVDWWLNAPPDTTQSGVWGGLEKRVASGSAEPVLKHVAWPTEGSFQRVLWGQLRALCDAVWMGLFFSLISAFSTGYKDLDVGRWIERIKREESTLRGTGWVRTLSGLQSLVSFYLLALWLLTYFGRPFE